MEHEKSCNINKETERIIRDYSSKPADCAVPTEAERTQLLSSAGSERRSRAIKYLGSAVFTAFFIAAIVIFITAGSETIKNSNTRPIFTILTAISCIMAVMTILLLVQFVRELKRPLSDAVFFGGFCTAKEMGIYRYEGSEGLDTRSAGNGRRKYCYAVFNSKRVLLSALEYQKLELGRYYVVMQVGRSDMDEKNIYSCLER